MTTTIEPTPIVFIDVETNRLHPARRMWEIGLIRRVAGGEETRRWFIDRSDIDLGNADPSALNVGRFYDRHPQVGKRQFVEDGIVLTYEASALEEVEALTRGATVVGIQVDFDAATLDARMRANGICPSWSHRIVDARTAAAGALRMPPPWDVNAIYEAFGVFCPEQDRHTALGDARLARDLYDAVFGTAPTAVKEAAAHV